MGTAEVNARLLVVIAVVVVAAKALGWLLQRAGQPRVMGEIIAGILLGPSLLGLVWPAATEYLFPAEVLSSLSAIAQLGLVLFMFLVGVDFDPTHLRAQGHRAVAISHASIILPMLLGLGLSVWLHPRVGGDTDPLGFGLFLGAAMAITAFPVLASMLQDSGLANTRIGTLTLTCAAVDDVTAWFVLAGVIATIQASGVGDVAVTLGWTALYLLVMVKVLRPLIRARERIPLAVAVGFALISAWTTELIGIHAIFGAFAAGAIIPSDSMHRVELTGRLESTTRSILLPMFFAVVGLSTRVDLLDSPYLWGIALVVIAVAIVGKLVGSTVAARLVGESWSDAVTIGVLMNTRGLTEIVILTVGLELGVIDETVFSIMVLMALVTTLMAWPTLRLAGVRLPTAGTRRPSPTGEV
jgi:Kef-type K+ transport system membrane component KefB